MQAAAPRGAAPLPACQEPDAQPKASKCRRVGSWMCGRVMWVAREDVTPKQGRGKPGRSPKGGVGEGA